VVDVTVSEPAAVSFTTPAKVNVTCKDGNNGSITVPTPAGGSGTGWTYSKDGVNWQSSNVFDNLKAGNYPIQVKDNNSCLSAVVNVTVSEPAAVSFATPTKVNVTCKNGNNGSITVPTPTGGSGSGWTYSKDGVNWQSSNIFNLLTAGNYPIQVKDNNSCLSAVVNVTVSEPAAVSFATPAKVNVTCKDGNNGSITVPTPSGGSGAGWTYSKDGVNWQSSNVFNGLKVGTYPIRVKDNNGCLSTVVNVTVSEPAAVSFTTPTKVNVTCKDGNNGSITVPTPAGGSGTGWTYSKDGVNWQSSNVFNNLKAGTYPILVKDDKGCLSAVVNVTVSEPNVILIDVEKANPVCYNSGNGYIKISVSGGITPYSYKWRDGSTAQLRYNLSGGTYSLTVTDANGCSKTAVVTLTDPEPMKINLGEDIILCKNMNTELNATTEGANIKYRWYKNGQLFSQTPVITVTEKGTYRVEVQAANGCIAKDEVNVSVRDYEIAADFAVATKTANTTITKLVNISYPYPDRTEWIIPANNPDINVISLTDEYADIVFRKNGLYLIGLRTWKGDCEKTVFKEVEIKDAGEVDTVEDDGNVPKGKTAFVESFIAYPNPSNGNFTVKVKLGMKADIRLRLSSITGLLVNERVLKGSDTYDVYYNINNINGLYILNLTSGDTNTSLKLIISPY
jgi:hypothetical protein